MRTYEALETQSSEARHDDSPLRTASTVGIIVKMMHRIFDILQQADDAVKFIVGLAVIAGLFSEGRRLYRWLKPTQSSAYWVERISYHFRNQGTVHIFGAYHREPSVEVIGRVTLTREQEAYAAALNPKVNDPHAMLAEEPDWSSGNLVLKVLALDYKEVKALTETGQPKDKTLRLVSANALVVCAERRKIILHRRAKNSRTYPDCLHTVGGGYMPPLIGGGKDDQHSLKETAIREVEEETRAHLTLESLPTLLGLQELKTGFVQFAFLGVEVSGTQLDKLPGNPNPDEGRPEQVSFDELPTKLRDPKWVPTGKAAVLAWLGLGAPGAGWHPTFNEKTAAELLKEILEQPEPAEPAAFSAARA